MKYKHYLKITGPEFSKANKRQESMKLYKLQQDMKKTIPYTHQSQSPKSQSQREKNLRSSHRKSDTLPLRD